MWRPALALWLWTPGAVRAEEEAPGALRLSADEILWEGDALTATGDVRLQLPDTWARAASLTWDASGFALTQPTLWVAGFEVEAEGLRWTPEDQALVVEGGRLNPCGGCPPAWTLESQALTWDAARERGRLERATLKVGPVPVLWAPRVPLRAEPVRVLPGLPTVARGPDGLQVSLPVAWQITPRHRAVIEPEWRAERGPRLLVDAALPGASLQAAGGWDLQELAWRGSLGGQLAESSPLWRGGAEGLWVSDVDYLSHFPNDYLVRSLPWTQTRAHLGWGPLSVAWRGWQESDARVRGVPSLVLSHGEQLGAWRLEGVARADLLDLQPRVELSGRASGRQALGPLELTPLLEARGWSAKGLGADGRGELGVGLPLWARHGAWRHELTPGVAGGYGLSVGSGTAWVDAQAIALHDPLGVAWAGVPLGGAPGVGLSPQGWWAGPRISSIWWASRKTLRLDVRGFGGEAGLGGSGEAALRLGGWELSAAAALREDAHLLSPRLRWEGEVLRVSLAWRSASGLQAVEQGVGAVGLALPGARGTWSPRVDAVARPDALAAWGTQLGWTAAGDCLSLGARLEFAEDRDGPQVGAWVRLTPRRAPTPALPGALSSPAP